MLKILLLLTKLACIVTLNYYVALLLWEYVSRTSELPRDLRLRAKISTTHFALSDIIFSTAILLIKTPDVGRVLRNLFIIFVCMIAGWMYGNPLSRGSYDHEGGMETIRGCTIGGIMGTLAGYFLVQWLNPRTKHSTTARDGRLIDG